MNVARKKPFSDANIADMRKGHEPLFQRRNIAAKEAAGSEVAPMTMTDMTAAAQAAVLSAAEAPAATSSPDCLIRSETSLRACSVGFRSADVKHLIPLRSRSQGDHQLVKKVPFYYKPRMSSKLRQ